MPEPRAVLMCRPDHYDVIDVKNPFMRGNIGTVDRARALAQWDALVAVFDAEGLPVERIEPVEGCEDMVFAANASLPGVDARGDRVCIRSRMTHASREREVPAYAEWFAAHGYAVADVVPEGLCFEGCGDAIWHPGRHALWAGYGHRTDREAHAAVSARLGAHVESLRLVDERFYHLDTCLCALDEQTALVFPGAFDDAARTAIARGFEQVVEIDEDEATRALACNAAAPPGGTVIIDQRAVRTIGRIEALGFRVLTVDTGEFLKSGGSVFCLKQFVY